MDDWDIGVFSFIQQSSALQAGCQSVGHETNLYRQRGKNQRHMDIFKSLDPQATEGHESSLHARVVNKNGSTLKYAVPFLDECIRHALEITAEERAGVKWFHCIWLLGGANYDPRMERHFGVLGHSEDAGSETGLRNCWVSCRSKWIRYMFIQNLQPVRQGKCPYQDIPGDTIGEAINRHQAQLPILSSGMTSLSWKVFNQKE